MPPDCQRLLSPPTVLGEEEGACVMEACVRARVYIYICMYIYIYTHTHVHACGEEERLKVGHVEGSSWVSLRIPEQVSKESYYRGKRDLLRACGLLSTCQHRF